MEHFHHSIGTIQYDPYRADMHRRTKWWCVVNVDREITRYYRWWLQKEKHIILQQPAWDAHISVVSGTPISHDKQHIWKKRHGQRMSFTYQHGDVQVSKDPNQPGSFFWVRVKCPDATELRRELGLPAYETFHMTVGRTYW